MKAVGLITEYNPLHLGHIHHIKEALKLTNADCCIAVMSGDFVQRGEPAIIDKYSRCAAAIDAGINLCIELPSYYAVSSAEQFADGAVRTLNSLLCSHLVFGSECGDILSLSNIARIISTEPEEYRTELKKLLADGKSFPAARQEALINYCQNLNLEFTKDIISSPNNILGIEYIKSIYKHGFDIKPLTISRSGTGYNEQTISGLPSASAVRKLIIDTATNPVPIKNDMFFKLMPEFMADTFLKNQQAVYDSNSYQSDLQPVSQNSYIKAPLTLDDMSHIFNYKMSEIFNIHSYDKNEIAKHLSSYNDISMDLGRRMAEQFKGCETLSKYCMRVKSRQYTYSRICRCALHIILNITKIKANKYDGDTIPYIRILGFDETGQKYLSQIKKNCSIPLITKTADYKDLLTEDIYCSSIYNQIIFHKYGTVLKDEFRSGIYIKK